MIAASLLVDQKIERVIVIAPRTKVVDQWAEEFEKVTKRKMIKIKPAIKDLIGEGYDVCSTWASIKNSLDAYQAMCSENKTLVICDENHHAAIDATWGTAAQGAFASAKYVLVLTGTPIRSDNKKTAHLYYSDGEDWITQQRVHTN